MKAIKNMWKRLKQDDEFMDSKTGRVNITLHPTLPKKARDILVDILKKQDKSGKMFGSFHIEKLKGGVTYKIYHEINRNSSINEEPAYIKLVFPKTEQKILKKELGISEIIISPLTLLNDAIKGRPLVKLTRFEFVKKIKNRCNYFYLFQVKDLFFDLPEELAKEYEKRGITINKYYERKFIGDDD